MKAQPADEINTAENEYGGYGGGGKPFDNLQTWPKSQTIKQPLDYRGLGDLHEWIRLKGVLNQAKSFIQLGATGPTTSPISSPNRRKVTAPATSAHAGQSDENRLLVATRIIKMLTKELESRVRCLGADSATRVGMFRKRHESIGPAAAASGQLRFNSIAAPSTQSVIREDPHFESMIICNKTTAPIVKNYGSIDTVWSAHHSARIPATLLAYSDGFDDDDDEEAAKSPAGGDPSNLNVVAELPDQLINDPALIRAVPHLLLLVCAVGYLVGGAYSFMWIDDKIAAKPFRIVLLFAFQTCTSIGWGDTWPSNSWSQLLCVVYTVFGVPIIFSALANIGRLTTEFYCVDWIFLTAVVRERVKMYTDKLFPDLPEVQNNFQAIEVRQRFPIRATINLLFVHQCIGVLLYGTLIKQFSVIEVIYFSITSTATTGYGDIRPDPKTLTEAVVLIVYISSGIIIFSALLLSIAYYFQRIIYVTVPNYLHYCYKHNCRRRTIKPVGGGSLMPSTKNYFSNAAA